MKCFDSSIYYFVLILRKLLGLCSRKNKREVVLQSAESALHTVCNRCNRCITLSLGFAKDWFASKSSRYFRAGFNRDTPDDKFTLRISLAS